MMSLWDALRMNMMISYQELVRTFPNDFIFYYIILHLSGGCTKKGCPPYIYGVAISLCMFQHSRRRIAKFVFKSFAEMKRVKKVKHICHLSDRISLLF